MNTNEQKFYEALERIFVGAEIEGEGGYINLMKIKSNYYKLVLKEFKKQVKENPIISGSFREEFFDRLYSFFEKYFSESGSIYFVKTAASQRVYEQIYTDNKDVVLFWKTHMLYYVKSDILFKSMSIKIEDEETKKEYEFYFDVGNLKNKKNNEKKEIIFNFREIKDRKIYVFDVSYSEKGIKTKIDEIVKKTGIKQEILEKAFRTFKKQTEVDFFINKNTKNFLTEQLDIYLHQILLNIENKFDQKRLDQIRTIKEYALKIIDFISQFEDELVRIWNKPKFVLNSNYVITLDKLNNEIIEKIAKHENLPKQIQERKELGMIDDDFDFNKRDEKHKFLPIDTKYFKDLEIDILSLFDDLDEALDGVLIKSENYQALNTILPKYKKKIKCIFIYPPYNTGNDNFIYKDGYKNSSWLTMMENRLSLAKDFLKDDGLIFCSIDENQYDNLKKLMNDIFGKENFIGNLIRKTRSTTNNVKTGFNLQHENYLIYCVNKDLISLLGGDKDLSRYKNPDNDPNGPWISDSPLMRNGINKNNYFPIVNPYTGKIDLPPEGRTWSFSKDKLDKYIKEGRITFKKEHKDDERGFIFKRYLKDLQSTQKTLDSLVFTNNEFMSQIGTKELESLGLGGMFQFPKPTNFIKKILEHSTNKNSIILDFFPWGGITVHAVINLNREDGGKRKYLLVEANDYFDTIIIPRIKKVIFSENWKDGKAQDGKGISHFFKYYELEQYEDVIKRMRYKDYNQDSLFTTNKNIFEQYIFFADEKFTHVVEVKENLDIDFDKLYTNIDFAETISNVLGLPIKKITKTSVILKDNDKEIEIKTDYKNMTNDEKIEFLKILKPLLWWGN